MTTQTYFTTLNQAYSMLSDMHKDAYGFRPRHYRNDLTIEEVKQEIDKLEVVIIENDERQRAWEMEQEMSFKALLGKTICLGAEDEETALKWVVEGSIDDPTDYFEIENFLFIYGMMHTDYGKIIKKRIIQIFG